ncbi:hypothetical protein K8I31_02885, partial [bacterium]|nr:hypothetical protein [bacterium]
TINRDGEIVSYARLIKVSVDNDDQARLGEFYFNDASVCIEEWQSCASCHPEGRMDGLNWDLLNDGEGNSKNTKSLLYTHETPPVMSTGVRESADIAIHAGLQHMMELKDDKEAAAAISAYMLSLKPRAKYSEGLGSNHCNSIKKGKQIFYSNEAQCSECHNGPYYTDLEKYDVDTMNDYDQRSEFDTPTLIETWRTAPYLHDGRAATLIEVFTKYNMSDFHGKTSHLTHDEINDLVAFLESL